MKIGEYTEKEFKLLEDGQWYECFVSEVDKPEFDVAKGVLKGNVNYMVRDDVHPDYAGAKINFDYFSEADNMLWKVNRLAKAIGVPVGTDFSTLEEFFDFIKGKPVMIKVKHRPNKDGSKIFAEANNVKATEVEGFVAPTDAGGEFTDDLPF